MAKVPLTRDEKVGIGNLNAGAVREGHSTGPQGFGLDCIGLELGGGPGLPAKAEHATWPAQCSLTSRARGLWGLPRIM